MPSDPHPAASAGFFPDATHGPRRLGDYELLDILGQGGMGTVYRSRQVSLDRIVALKLLHAGPLAAPDRLARFRAEARAAGRLRHPNIVAIHEVGDAGGIAYYSMDYIEGATLASVVASGPMPPDEAARLLATVSRAVAAAHDAGILHRDLKPGNVLLDRNRQPHVADFGLAKELDLGRTLTASGDIVGSPAYMAPEQADPGLGRATRESDVYGLGATLYHLLTGRPPFAAATAAATLHQVLHSDLAAPRVLNPAIPRDLETITLRAMAREATHRYPTALALAEDLDRHLTGAPILARPVSPAERAWRWCRRHRAIAALSTLALLLLVGIAVVATVAALRIQQARTAELAGRDTIEANLYAADMVAVQRAYEQGNLGRALALLEAHVPKPGSRDRRGFEWHLFRKWCEGDPHVVLHKDPYPLIALAISPDERLAAIASPVALKVVDIARRTVTHEWPLPRRAEARSIAWTPDGAAIASTERDGVWIHTLSNPTPRILPTGPCDTLAISPYGNRIAVCDVLEAYRKQHSISTKIWNETNALNLTTLTNIGGPALAWSTNNNDLFCVGPQGQISLWDQRKGIEELTPPAEGWGAYARFTPNSDYIFRVSWEGTARLTDISTYKNIITISNLSPLETAFSAALTRPNHLRVAISSTDQRIHLYDIGPKDHSITYLTGHQDRIRGMALLNNGRSVLSLDQKGHLIAWTSQTNYLRDKIPAEIVLLAAPQPTFSEDGTKLAVQTISSTNHEFTVFDFRRLSELRRDCGQFIAFDSSSDSFLFDACDGTIMQATLEQRRVRNFSLSHVRGFHPTRMSLDRRLILRVDTNDIAVIYQWPSLVPIATNQSTVWWAQFTPRADRLLLAGPSGIRSWSFASGLEAVITTEEAEEFAVSTDGKALAVPRDGNVIAIIDLGTKSTVGQLSGHQGEIASIDFSTDGKTLATTSADRTTRIWNLPTFRETLRLVSDEAGYFVKFSPDSRKLIVGSRTGYRILDSKAFGESN